MQIVIASTNPVKIHGATEAFRAYFADNQIIVTSISVDSTVGHQPFTDDETIKGAIIRAQKALALSTNIDYSIGLEGGISKIQNRFYTCAWSAIVDSCGRIGLGSSHRVELPPPVVKLVLEGRELGDANDQIFKRKNSKQAEGYTGIATRNLLTRQDMMKTATLAALARYTLEKYFQ